MRVAINGFGRMGRLALRAATGREDLEVVAVNEPAMEASAAALLAEFDSVQGRWGVPCAAAGSALIVGGRELAFSRERDPAALVVASGLAGLPLAGAERRAAAA